MVFVEGPEARDQGGPANVISDPDGAQTAIIAALSKALTALTLPLEALQDARIVAGLAGCRQPGTADSYATRLPFLGHVVDDSVTALNGAFGGGDGTLINLGTGSFFIHRDARGITHQGSWELHLGDEGSAAWLGREALNHALNIVDGSEWQFADDPLLDALHKACATHPVVFARNSAPEDFAALAPLVMEATSPLSKRLRLQVLIAVQQGVQRIGHPDCALWALAGALGRTLAEQVTGKMAEDLRAPAGTALDGALAMARVLP